MELSIFISNFALIITIISLILVILGIVMIRWMKKKVQLQVIFEYYKELADEELTENRKQLLNKVNENLNYEMEESKAESNVCDFFNKWAFMVKAKYLPFYMFKGSSGTEVLQLYDNLKEYIAYRKKDNPEYCKEFEYLNYRISNNKFD